MNKTNYSRTMLWLFKTKHSKLQSSFNRLMVYNWPEYSTSNVDGTDPPQTWVAVMTQTFWKGKDHLSSVAVQAFSAWQGDCYTPGIQHYWKYSLVEGWTPRGRHWVPSGDPSARTLEEGIDFLRPFLLVIHQQEPLSKALIPSDLSFWWFISKNPWVMVVAWGMR